MGEGHLFSDPSGYVVASAGPGARPVGDGQSGLCAFTLVEMSIVLVIIATLTTITVPVFVRTMQDAKKESTVEEMRQIVNEITAYIARTGDLPNSLADIGMDHVLDPWGRPYEYLRIAAPVDPDGGGKGGGGGGGQFRKDHFLVPLNSDYDLYSMGPDGKSSPPLTAKASHDDIIRANDGAYFGPASEY